MSHGFERFFMLRSFCIIVIDSMPPPMTASAPSTWIWCAATATAFSPDEQNRETVPPGTVTGSPERRATLRPTLKPCGPSGKPVPMMTSSISLGSSWGVLRRTSLTQWAAMSSGRVWLNEPRNDLARPVLAVATIATSRIAIE